MEKKFHCTFPDEFIFTQMATLSELSHIVKIGELTPSQEDYLAQGHGGGGEGDGNGDGDDDGGGAVGSGGNKQTRSTVMEDEISTPLCPWFTCCS